MAKTALAYREEAKRHDTGPMHPESPKRLDAIIHAFEKAQLDPPRLDFFPARRKDLLPVHTESHVAAVSVSCSGASPCSDPDTIIGPGSWEAAMLSVGAGLGACRAVLDKEYDNVFCAMRPPGHHAERDHAMGFCLFNNVAIAARWLRDTGGVARVAILDWDVHHGNGTQHITYDDDTLYYASMHQHPHYPGTGYPHERGKNNTNLNVQMPPGCAPEEWISALGKMILPEFERFDPEFLLISTGFDAHRLDPLGRQLLEAEHFAQLTEMVKGVAGGRIVTFLEGGYNLDALGLSAVAHFKALQKG